MNIPTAQYHVKTLQGFEELVVDELKLHGATDIVKGRRGVNFTATAEAMYRHCMHARFTLRVLRTLHTFSAKHRRSVPLISKIRLGKCNQEGWVVCY